MTDSTAAPRGRGTALGVRVVIAGLVLTAAEVVGLLELGYPLDGPRLFTLAALLTSLALAAEVAVTVAWWLARRLSPARAPWVLALFAMPLAFLAAESLFSGNFIRDVKGVAWIKFLFGAALVLAVRVGVALHARVAAEERVPWQRLWAAASLVAVGAFGWVDTHVQVGLYPAAHLLLGAAVLFGAHLLARTAGALVPGSVTRATIPCVVLVVIAVGGTIARWDSAETASLVSYSHGLAPKFRRVVVSALPAHAWDESGAGDVVPYEPAVVADEPQNLLEDGDDLVQPSWVRGGRRAEIVPDDALAPDGTRTADLVRFDAGVSTVVQLTDRPAAERTFTGSVWIKRKSGPDDGQVDLLLMDGKDGRFGRAAATPSTEWTELTLTHAFTARDDQGRLIFRIGNDYTDPAPLDVWLWGATLFEESDEPEPAFIAGGGDGSTHRRGPSDPDEFRFRPSDSPLVDSIRSATRNVVFVLLDAFREDHLGRIEDGASLTPALDALAAEGLRFTSVYSPSDHTGRSMPSVMTSLPLGVVNRTAELEVPVNSWIHYLEERGFRSFNNGSDYVSRKFKHILVGYCFGSDEQGTLDPKADGLVDEVLEFVDRPSERPFAVYTHWSDVHVRRTKDMAAVYREEVRRVDDRLRRLVDGLKERDLWDETLLVVTSDHGYALGENNVYLGAQGCRELSLRVPLLIHAPGLATTGRVITDNVSGHDLVGTLLDVLAPRANALVWSPGIWGLVERDGDAGAGGVDSTDGRIVFSSVGSQHALRDGDWKLVVDEDSDVALLYDLSRDPTEREPVADVERAAALRDRLSDVLRRQGRLTEALVRRHHHELDPGVVAAFMTDEPTAPGLESVLAGFWSFNSTTRRFALSSLLQRERAGVDVSLDRLAREEWTDDDQLLLVVRTWAGSGSAAAELHRRWRDLGTEGRRWLSELVGQFPRDVARDLSDDLVAEVTRQRGEHPALGSPEERFVVLAAHGLARVLRRDAPRAVRELLVDIFNDYSRDDPGPYFPTLLTRKFIRRELLYALGETITDDDLDLLERLVLNRDVAICVPRMCLDLDSRSSRRFLLDLIDRWHLGWDSSGNTLAYMLPSLKQFDDDSFREEANRRIQARFPRVPTFQ